MAYLKWRIGKASTRDMRRIIRRCNERLYIVESRFWHHGEEILVLLAKTDRLAAQLKGSNDNAAKSKRRLKE